MKVLWIDPGEKVGYATASVTDGVRLLSAPYVDPVETEPCSLLHVETAGIATLKEFALQLADVAGGYDVIGYETYTITAGKAKAHIGSSVPTLQLIGMIRLACWLNPTVQVVTQSPAKKSTADRVIATNPVFADIDKRIKAAPLTHDEAHDTDALRHLAYWFWKRFL